MPIRRGVCTSYLLLAKWKKETMSNIPALLSEVTWRWNIPGKRKQTKKSTKGRKDTHHCCEPARPALRQSRKLLLASASPQGFTGLGLSAQPPAGSVRPPHISKSPRAWGCSWGATYTGCCCARATHGSISIVVLLLPSPAGTRASHGPCCSPSPHADGPQEPSELQVPLKRFLMGLADKKRKMCRV